MSGLVLRVDLLERLLPAWAGRDPHRWLSAGEFDRFESIRDAGARLRFLSGRWLVKQMLVNHDPRSDQPPRAYPQTTNQAAARHAQSPFPRLCRREGRGEGASGEALTRWHIESRDGQRRGIAPRIYHDGRLLGVRASISHTNTAIGAAICRTTPVSIGLDLTPFQTIPAGVVDYWFTPRERREYHQRPWSAMLIWSAKEAYYKSRTTRQQGGHTPGTIESLDWLAPLQVERAVERLHSGSPTTNLLGSSLRLHWLRYEETLISVVTDASNISFRHDPEPVALVAGPTWESQYTASRLRPGFVGQRDGLKERSQRLSAQRRLERRH